MPSTVSPPVRAARRWGELYRRCGWTVLPTSLGDKKPLVRYIHLWESDDHPDLLSKFDTPNLQVMLGRHHGLCVLDLDGKPAMSEWSRLSTGRPLPRTWVVETPGGGLHLWWRTPTDMPETRRVRLWGRWDPSALNGRGSWVKREGIELLCDRSLVMAPPSTHPNGRIYRFLRGSSPCELARPAYLPRWVIRLPPALPPRVEPPRPLRMPGKAPRRPCTGSLDFRRVLDCIPDKIAVARSWGLRFAARPCECQGWVSVHDYDREDVHPSARFHRDRGCFWRPGEKCIGLFSLGVVLGIYPDRVSCCAALASEFLRGRF